MQGPDPRRIDVRASLRDPFGQLLVRVCSQKTSVPVYAVGDLSASMGVVVGLRKLDLVAGFVVALGYSAYRTGDPFGIVGSDRGVRDDVSLPLARAKSVGPVLGGRLRGLTELGRGSEGLSEAVRRLPSQRALVFVVSDFQFPMALWEQAMTDLTGHVVVPVVISDSRESRDLPGFGIAQALDADTGARRTLLMCPALRERIRERYAGHRRRLARCCRDQGVEPLWVTDAFTAAQDLAQGVARRPACPPPPIPLVPHLWGLALIGAGLGVLGQFLAYLYWVARFGAQPRSLCAGLSRAQGLPSPAPGRRPGPYGTAHA
jgi:uncharacterized protein (DUF58 family)